MPTSTAFRVFSVLTMRGVALSCKEGDGTRRSMRAGCLHGAASRLVAHVLPLGRLATLWAFGCESPSRKPVCINRRIATRAMGLFAKWRALPRAVLSRALEGEGGRGNVCACPTSRVCAITSPATKSRHSSASRGASVRYDILLQ
jgi:hypothetical protein